MLSMICDLFKLDEFTRTARTSTPIPKVTHSLGVVIPATQKSGEPSKGTNVTNPDQVTGSPNCQVWSRHWPLEVNFDQAGIAVRYA